MNNNNDILNKDNIEFGSKLEGGESIESPKSESESIEEVYSEFKFEPKQEIARIEKRFDGFQDKLTESEISNISNDLSINQKLENISNKMDSQKKSILEISKNNTSEEQDKSNGSILNENSLSIKENVHNEQSNTDENLKNFNLENNSLEENIINPLSENNPDTINTNPQENEQKDKDILIKGITDTTSYLNTQYTQSIDTLKSLTTLESPVQDKLFEFLIQSELQSKINSQLEINQKNLNNESLMNLDITQLNQISQSLENIKSNNLDLFQKIDSLTNITEDNFDTITQGIQNSLNKFDLDSYNLKKEINLNKSVSSPDMQSSENYLDQKAEIESILSSNIKEIKDTYTSLKTTIKNSVSKNPALKEQFREIYLKGNAQKNIMSSMDSVSLIENSLENLDLSQIKEINQTIVELKAKFNQFLIANNELVQESTEQSKFDSKSDFLIQTSEEINQSFNLLKEKIN